MVGTRYSLSAVERSMLFRGVFKATENKKRKARSIDAREVKGKIVTVDCLNQLLTIASYVAGQPVFRATDGFIRDASEFHGQMPPGHIIEKAVDLMIASLEKLKPLHTDFLIDIQVDGHDTIASMIRFEAFEERFPFQVLVSEQVDQKMIALIKGIVCSSDSGIIDRTKRPVFDLSDFVLTDHFNPKIPILDSLLQIKQ